MDKNFGKIGCHTLSKLRPQDSNRGLQAKRIRPAKKKKLTKLTNRDKEKLAPKPGQLVDPLSPHNC